MLDALTKTFTSQWGSMLGHEGSGPGYNISSYVLFNIVDRPIAVTAVVSNAEMQATALSKLIFKQIK